MGTAGASLWNAWRFWQRNPPPPFPLECIHLRHFWRRLRRRDRGICLEGSRYCLDQCLDHALQRALQRISPGEKSIGVRHRIPLGLVLLSQQRLTIEQLRAALAAQRHAGRGRIGEWIAELGFASEQQITTALARQWACPVLRTNPCPAFCSAESSLVHAPLALFERFAMFPVNFFAHTSTLRIAFAEGVDHNVLYAIEQMTGCHTEACMATPSFVRGQLEVLARQGAKGDLTFENVADNPEISRIIRSYSSRTGASEIRLAACPPYFWVRLLRADNSCLDILIGVPTLPSPNLSSTDLTPDF